MVWLISIAGIIITFIYALKQSKHTKIYTHINKINTLIWIAFSISYIIIIVFLKNFNYQIYALIFLIGGNSIFLSGIVLKFKPLILGGISFWIACIISFYLSEEYNLLLSSVIIFCWLHYPWLYPKK